MDTEHLEIVLFVCLQHHPSLEEEMLDNLGKTVGTLVEERLSSPLLSTFVLSWCAWNYRFLIIVLSDASVSTTFRMIDTVAFPTLIDVALRGIAYPLITTAFYIYIYPYPSRLVYEAWRRTQQELNRIRQRYEDQQPLTLEESRQLRAESVGLADELERTREALRKARSDVAGYQRQLVEAQSTNAPQDAAGQPVRPAWKPEAITSSAPSPISLTPLTSDGENFLRTMAKHFGEIAEWNDLRSASSNPADRVKQNYVVEDLINRGLLQRVFNDGVETGVAFTQTGRKQLFEPDAPL